MSESEVIRLKIHLNSAPLQPTSCTAWRCGTRGSTWRAPWPTTPACTPGTPTTASVSDTITLKGEGKGKFHSRGCSPQWSKALCVPIACFCEHAEPPTSLV